MTASNDLATLLAKQDITDALNDYCRATDRGDESGLRACFHPEATVTMGAFDGLASDYITNRILPLRASFLYEAHFVTNMAVKVAGDRAASEAYFLARHIWKDATTGAIRTRLTEGRYLDTWEKRDGTWRIAKRHGLMPMVQETDLVGVANVPDGKDGWAPHDPVYAHFAALGR